MIFLKHDLFTTLLGLDTLIDPVPSRQRDLVVAMIISVIRPSSKLACAKGLKCNAPPPGELGRQDLSIPRCESGIGFVNRSS